MRRGEEKRREEVAKFILGKTAADWFASYHTFDEFNTYLTNLTTTFPTLIKYLILFFIFYFLFDS